MSRVSLSRRLAALLEAAEQIDPFATRVHRMRPATRIRYELWRRECDAVHEQYAPGALYEAMLNDTLPEMPAPHPDVARALGLDEAVHIPADATAQRPGAAQLWAEMVAD